MHLYVLRLNTTVCSLTHGERMMTMPKAIASFQVKDWAQWEAAFTGHNEARENAQIKTIYYGHELSTPNNVCHNGCSNR
jgi:hypothetical protein